MKKVKWIVSSGLMVMLLVVGGCGGDESAPALTLVSLKAGTMDLNGAASATNVPVGSTIVATFSAPVTEASLSAITLIRDYDGAAFSANITVAGATVTIAPTNNFSTGAVFILRFGTGLTSNGGKMLTADIERSFTTEGKFLPAGVIAHWTFESNANDVVGAFDPTNTGTDISYVDSRNTEAGKAASFNGTTSLVEIPNGHQLMANGNFAVSFWVKVNSTKEGHFVFGLGGYYGFQFEILGGPWTAIDKGVKLATRYQLASSTAAEDTWWNGNPNTWQGSTFAADVSGSGGIAPYFKDKWAHVVCSYNKTSKVGSMYVNGRIVRSWDFNLWPAGDTKRGATGVVFAGNTSGGGNNFAIGFIQAPGNPIIGDSWAVYSDPSNNHFKGLLDDIRIYSGPLTEKAALLMYNSEKP